MADSDKMRVRWTAGMLKSILKDVRDDAPVFGYWDSHARFPLFGAWFIDGCVVLDVEDGPGPSFDTEDDVRDALKR